MLFLWLATSLLAASPDLHRLLHLDAQDPNHHCLVSQLQEHSPLAASSVMMTPVPAVSLQATVCVYDFVPFSFDYRLSPSRAPPSV